MQRMRVMKTEIAKSKEGNENNRRLAAGRELRKPSFRKLAVAQ